MSTNKMGTSRRVRSFLTGPLALLVGVNLIPLAGVLVFGWSIHALLIVYWLEGLLIGLLNIPKILIAHGAETSETRRRAKRNESNGEIVTLPDPPESIPETPKRRAENWSVVRFYVKSQIFIWILSGVFVWVLPIIIGSEYIRSAELTTVLFAVGAAGVSDYVSYRRDYLAAGEWRTTSPGERFNSFTDRTIVLILTIVVGGMIANHIGQPAIVLVVMIGVKTVYDVRTYLKEHKQSKTDIPEPS